MTPYPPGFPVLVPGQLFSRQILSFIRDLDTPEIHGYQPDFGYRVYTDKAIEMTRPLVRDDVEAPRVEHPVLEG